MTPQTTQNLDWSVLDSTLSDQAYSPEEVALLETTLEDVCSRAAPLVPINEGVRTLLASAILEGARLGIRDHEQLATLALRVLPPFRDRGADF